ncbi:MAG: hypothetical protein ACRD2G_02715, partial [Terriglobia bacterium]
NDAQHICDKAHGALECIRNIRSRSPSDCAKRVHDVFLTARELLMKLLGTSAASGLLNAGDPTTVHILNQAIQYQDRKILIDFDDGARRAYNAIHFLELVDTSVSERARLFEPAINVADRDINGWEAACGRFCALLEKTNGRIMQIRSQLMR